MLNKIFGKHFTVFKVFVDTVVNFIKFFIALSQKYTYTRLLVPYSVSVVCFLFFYLFICLFVCLFVWLSCYGYYDYICICSCLCSFGLAFCIIILLWFNIFLETEISVYNLVLFINCVWLFVHLLVHACVFMYIFLQFIVLIICNLCFLFALLFVCLFACLL